MPLFNVTYEVWTQEDTEIGETNDKGFISKQVRLREAIDDVRMTRTNRVGGVESIEANDSQIGDARWITIYNGMEFETGAHESRSIHFPDNLTPSSRRRIARILGVRGA